VTAPTPEEAAALARRAVEARLAACAQVEGPVRSIYWWDGAVQEADEWRCVLKTAAPRADHLAAELRRWHSYDVPEILVTAIEGGDDDYLAWVRGETGR
jgi:periplasmic divalent cation tolerance protein